MKQYLFLLAIMGIAVSAEIIGNTTMYPAIEGGAIVTQQSSLNCPGGISLDSTDGYCAGKSGVWNGLDQYVEIKNKEVVQWTHIETQGRASADNWVTAYKVYYSPDGTTWSPTDAVLVAPGNTDRNSKVSHVFQPVINAKALRIVPITWNIAIGIRMEAYHKPTPGDLIMLKIQEFLLQFGEQLTFTESTQDLWKITLNV